MSISKFKLIQEIGKQHEHFPFKQQMYAIYTLSVALNCRVFFEQTGDDQHTWTVQSSNGRNMGKFTIFCKVEDRLK